MTRALAWLMAVVAVLGSLPGPAAAVGQPVVRVAIDPPGPVLVGQTVTVSVTILVPNFFTSGLTFPTIDIPGAVVAMPEERPQNLNETIDGETYAGLQRSFRITPQRAGEFTLPPVKITFRYATEPGKPTDASVALPPQKFTAKLPPGAPAASGAAPGAPAAATSVTAVTPVAKVTLTQTLDRGPKSLQRLRPGDALARTVVAFAERTQAMMIPPPTFDAPAGVRVYRQDPVLKDETSDRGEFMGGRRTDRATYLFEQPGEYALPAIEIAWFNPATGKSETARAPAIKVSVAATPGTTAAIPPEPPPAEAAPPTPPRFDWRRWAPWIGGVGGALLLLGSLAWRYVPRYRTWRAARHRARRESEPAYFARAEQACRTGDAAAAYRALGDWARRAGVGSLTAWCDRTGAADLRSQVGRLEQTLFSWRPSPEPWDGRRFATALTGARDNWLADRGRGSKRPAALPALNP